MNIAIEKIGLTVYVGSTGIVTIAQRDALIVIPPEYVREVSNAVAQGVIQLVPHA